MRIKKYIVLLLFFVCLGTVRAQQLSQYTQYMFNNYLLNPGVAGSSTCLDIKTGYRTQWIGFENRPKSGFISAYKQLKFPKMPMMKQKHALGAYFENDNTGPISMRNSFYLSYTIHTPLARNIWLGAGIFGGVMLYTMNPGNLVTATPGDATINSAGSKFIVPDFSPGLWLYSPRAYAGLSVKSIIGNTIFDKSSLTRHYYLTGGYKFSTKTPWSFIPSAFVRYSYASPIGFDANIMADFDGQFDIGLSYRLTEGFAALVKFNIRKFTIGYSYDYTLSKLRLASSNTHEIMLGIKICNGERAINVNGTSDPDLNRCPTFN